MRAALEACILLCIVGQAAGDTVPPLTSPPPPPLAPSPLAPSAPTAPPPSSWTRCSKEESLGGLVSLFDDSFCLVSTYFFASDFHFYICATTTSSKCVQCNNYVFGVLGLFCTEVQPYNLLMRPVGSTTGTTGRRLSEDEEGGTVACIDGADPTLCSEEYGCTNDALYISQAFLNDPNDDVATTRNIVIFADGEPISYTVPAGKYIENYTKIGLDAYTLTNETWAIKACDQFDGDGACVLQVANSFDSNGRYYLRSSDIELSEELTDEVLAEPGEHTLAFTYPVPDTYGSSPNVPDDYVPTGCEITYRFTITVQDEESWS